MSLVSFPCHGFCNKKWKQPKCPLTDMIHFYPRCGTYMLWNIVKSLGPVQLLGTPLTAAHRAPLSMRFLWQDAWSGLPLPLPSSEPAFALSPPSGSLVPFHFLPLGFSPVAQSCPTLCDPMNCSTPGLPVHHQLMEFNETSVESVMPSSHLILSSPSAPSPSQHQSFPVSQLFT